MNAAVPKKLLTERSCGWTLALGLWFADPALEEAWRVGENLLFRMVKDNWKCPRPAPHLPWVTQLFP